MASQIPVLKVDEFLIASIQTALDDRSVIEFQEHLLNTVSQEDAAGVIIDITALDVVDSFMARSLNDMAIAAYLLGAKMAIIGIQPDVAIPLVKMGLTIPNAITALNLEKGMKALRKFLAREEEMLTGSTAQHRNRNDY